MLTGQERDVGLRWIAGPSREQLTRTGAGTDATAFSSGTVLALNSSAPYGTHARVSCRSSTRTPRAEAGAVGAGVSEVRHGVRTGGRFLWLNLSVVAVGRGRNHEDARPSKL
ncbi:hypothetical protein GCM10010346_61190 [Streptomyces chryseus]|uniref:Uncharacterized protein n=1 Tax=Streptomyces chryseus TaxID=68186 RepID=A0ABQ3EBD6_9ACTN|nr:hypothetical protein [Streptomyces chryseus]GHB29435.1 hypothetical protein GCM10010346_61190 [Streptomyces chryseus]